MEEYDDHMMLLMLLALADTCHFNVVFSGSTGRCDFCIALMLFKYCMMGILPNMKGFYCDLQDPGFRVDIDLHFPQRSLT